MDLIVLNEDLDAVSVIDSYSSLIWTDRYDSYGDFEICTAATPEMVDMLKQDYYITCRESEHTMIVEKIWIKSDSEEGNMLYISGRSLESILDRRIIWGQKTITGSLQNGIRTLLNECIISPTDSARVIPNFIFEKSLDTSVVALTVDAQYTGDNLYDVIQKLCTEAGIGFRILLNDNKQFVFSLYNGVDRSYKSSLAGNSEVPYVVFSPNFDNIINSNYIESKMPMKNIALIGGTGVGTERKYHTTDASSNTGLHRRELFVDARDVSDKDDDGNAYTESEYNAKLEQRGKEYLEENKEVVSFEGKVEATIMFKYGEDFFIGDIIQIANEYGHETESRISEIVISDDSEGFSIYPTFTVSDKPIAKLLDYSKLASLKSATFSVDGSVIVVTGKNAYSGAQASISKTGLIGETIILRYNTRYQSDASATTTVQIRLETSNGTQWYGPDKPCIIPEDTTSIHIQILVNDTATDLTTSNTLTIEGLRLEVVE